MAMVRVFICVCSLSGRRPMSASLSEHRYETSVHGESRGSDGRDTARSRRLQGVGMDLDFSGLRAMFINCTLKRSPEPSHTQGLVDVSAAIMRKHGVEVEVAPRRSTTTSPPASTPT